MASAYWQGRNRKAQAQGYKDWYDYRMHGYGATPPSAPRPTGERARQLRGHAGPAALRREADRAALVIVDPEQRDPKTGQWQAARIVVTDVRGNERQYLLRKQHLRDRELLAGIVGGLAAGGARVYDVYALIEHEPSEDDLDAWDFDEDAA